MFDAPTTGAITDFITARLEAVAPPAGRRSSPRCAAQAAASRAVRGPELQAMPSSSAPPAVSIIATALRPLVGATQPVATAPLPELGPLPLGDAIIPVPVTRWDADAHAANAGAGLAAAVAGSGAARFGAFVRGIEAFDAAAFGMSPAEAAAADPQHRLLLEAAAQLLAVAGSAPVAAPGSGLVAEGVQMSDAGVFVGISWTEYHRIAAAHGVQIGTYSAQGAVLSVACGRWVQRGRWGGSGALQRMAAPRCQAIACTDALLSTGTHACGKAQASTQTPSLHAAHSVPTPTPLTGSPITLASTAPACLSTLPARLPW